jgi:hypothetical protein
VIAGPKTSSVTSARVLFPIARLSFRALVSIFSPRRPFALIAAIVLPILLFAVAVSLLLDRQDRSAIQRELDLAARSASFAVNLKLGAERRSYLAGGGRDGRPSAA